jgi:hypothetical protein
MAKFQDSTIPDLLQAQRTAEQIAAEIERLKQLPEKLKQEHYERMNTLPPSDVVEHRLRENEFEQSFTRSEAGNSLREVERHLWVMLLLIFAVAAVGWWAYRAMERYGVL